MYLSAVCFTLPHITCISEASQYILVVCYATLPIKKPSSKSLHKRCWLPSSATKTKVSHCVPAVGYLTPPRRQIARKYIPVVGCLTLTQRKKQVNIYPMLITSLCLRDISPQWDDVVAYLTLPVLTSDLWVNLLCLFVLQL